MPDEDCLKKIGSDQNLAGRMTTIEALVLNLLTEVRTNNRILLVAICLIAAGKEVLQALK